MQKGSLKVVLAENNVQERESRVKAMQEAGLQVVYSTGDGKRALDAILREQPDLVVMDMILPGLDGMGILEETEQADMPRKPVMLIVTALKASQMITEALQRGADYYMMKPISNRVLIKRVMQISTELRKYGEVRKVAKLPEMSAQECAQMEVAATCETPAAKETVNVVSLGGEESLVRKKHREHGRYSGDLERDVTNVLLEIGIPAHIKGYQYIRQGIILAFYDRNMLQYITKYLYPAIAKKNQTTSSSVERTIRHAIEVAWKRGNLEVLEEIFGNTVCAGKGKPTNSEFLALLTDRFRLEYREKIVS